MSLAKAAQWKNIPDADLDELEKSIKEEKKRRYEEKDKIRNESGMNVLLKIWPNLDQSGVVSDVRLDKNEILLIFAPSPSHLANLKEKEGEVEVDSPPYRINLRKYDYDNKENYALHIDLNSARGCTSSPLLTFNFGAEKSGSMGKHWQFSNYGTIPDAFLKIPIISDMFYTPKKVFDEYLKHKQ